MDIREIGFIGPTVTRKLSTINKYHAVCKGTLFDYFTEINGESIEVFN